MNAVWQDLRVGTKLATLAVSCVVQYILGLDISFLPAGPIYGRSIIDHQWSSLTLSELALEAATALLSPGSVSVPSPVHTKRSVSS